LFLFINFSINLYFFVINKICNRSTVLVGSIRLFLIIVKMVLTYLRLFYSNENVLFVF